MVQGPELTSLAHRTTSAGGASVHLLRGRLISSQSHAKRGILKVRSVLVQPVQCFAKIDQPDSFLEKFIKLLNISNLPEFNFEQFSSRSQGHWIITVSRYSYRQQ